MIFQKTFHLPRLILALLITLVPFVAQATCKGADLRKNLSAEQTSALAQQISKVPYAQGIHWVAQKGDQQIHVVGTLHAGDRRLNGVFRSLTPYLKTADLVLLEIRGKDIAPQWKALKKDPKALFRYRGPYVKQLMRPELWDTLSLKMQVFGLSPAQVNRVQPWYISNTMIQSDCNPFGWNRTKGLDARVERFARNKKIPVAGLETVVESVTILSRQPIRDQVKLLELNITSNQSSATMATTLRNGYFSENLAEAMLLNHSIMYSDVNVSRGEVRRLIRSENIYLLDQRNIFWMPRILAYKQKTIFMAVGAAHLPGRNGVLNLLRKKGYTLTRIPL